MMKPSEIASQVENNPNLEAQMKQDPAATLRAMTTPLSTDPWIYRVVVISLGLVVLISLGGILFLSYTSHPSPDGVTALGSTALGALAGLLVLPRER